MGKPQRTNYFAPKMLYIRQELNYWLYVWLKCLAVRTHISIKQNTARILVHRPVPMKENISCVLIDNLPFFFFIKFIMQQDVFC